MTRRAFLESTVLTASAAALPLSAVSPAEARRTRIGFLGVAHSHALEKFRVARESADFDIAGICEESAVVREPFAKLGATLVSQSELLDRSEVIVVESAVRDHAQHARVALKAGKHVHVEKPPAVTMREMEELVRLAHEKKRLLQTGYMWRFNPGFVAAMEAARNGWLGDVYLVRATMNTLIPPNRRPEWAEFKGGAMFEQGCHLIDVVVRLLGKPAKVTPFLQRRGSDDLADNCVAVFEFAKAQAIVTNSVLQPNAFPHRFLEILGTNGTAMVKPIEPPALQFDLAKAAGLYKAGVQMVQLPAYRRYVGEFAALTKAIREQQARAFSLDDELLIQETLLRACEML